jgi:hypothetical protein
MAKHRKLCATAAKGGQMLRSAMWFIGKLIGDFAIPISQFFSKVLGWVFVPLWVAVLADVFRHVPS